MALRLEPADEYLHPLGPEPTFNESMYFNLYDPSAQLGGFFRLGNRANEGYAEMTVCLYLPDGRVAFMFDRPRIADNAAFCAGGMRFEVLRPFEELTVTYDGQVLLLEDPLQLADPKRAFSSNPVTTAHVALRYRGLAPAFGGEPEHRGEPEGLEFARGHYEQLVAASGEVAIGEDRHALDGYGLRDHSWGPRSWQAPWYYRWLTANFGPTFGLMGSRIARRDGPGTRGGFVWDGTSLHVCDDITISTEWSGSEAYHRVVEARLSAGARSWHLTGTVMSLVPLRNRKDGAVTRISEGMTRWTLDDGRVGYGLSEYLDQIVDGKPVGLTE